MVFRSTGGAAALGFALLLVAGCTKDPADLLQNAASFEQAGDYPAAIIELKSAIQLAPEDGALRFTLGRLYNAAFEPVPAEKELRAARRLAVTEGGRVDVELARSLRAQGKFKDLLADVPVMDGVEPANAASLHALRGRAEHALGHTEEAEAELGKARALEADSPDAVLLEAQIKAGKREFAAALDVLEGLLDKQPNYFDAWTYKAELLRVLRRDEDAVAAYGKILKMHPRNFAALVSRSSLLVGQGKLEEAAQDVAALNRAYKGHPQAFVQTGILELANGHPREALDAARAALKLTPGLASATLLAGLANNGLGLHEQAEQLLSAHMAGNPADSYARRVLGETLVELDQPARALEVLDPLLKQGTEDARVYATAGTALMAVGDKVRANEFFEKAASIKPADTQLQIQRAISMIGSGDGDLGLQELQTVLAAAKSASRADEYLVLSLLQQNELDRAWEAVEALEKRTPGTAITSNLRGVVLMAKGDEPAAKVAFEAAAAKEPGFLPAAKNLVQLDLARGDAAAARARYATAMAADKENVQAMMAGGELELLLGDKDRARALFEQAATAAPDAVEPRKQLIALYLADGEAQKAVEVADKALAISGADARLIILAAYAQREAGNANQAEQTIGRLIREYPESEQAHIRVAEFQVAAGRPEDATATLRKALARKSKSAALQVALVSQLVNQRQFDEALSLARSAQEAQPKAPIGDILEGEIHESAKDYDKASASYQRALAKQAIGTLAVKVFLAEARGGDVDGALGRLQAWADRHPSDPSARAQIGDVFLGRGDYKAAAEQYEQIIATKQAPLEVLNNLAFAYQSLKDERALQYAEAAYQAAPNSGMVVDTLGWILLEKGEAERALGYLRRAALLAPDQPEVIFHLASAHAGAGDAKTARAVLDELLKKHAEFPSRAAAKALRDTL